LTKKIFHAWLTRDIAFRPEQWGLLSVCRRHIAMVVKAGF
jgi:hypothetical protein